MGVLGITPFLQKTCPHVFSRLPDRLRSLRGKTVVVDGTLVTQRLHFAPVPHPHRHLVGWHRILAELRDADVRAICVFDGPQRSAAKAREVERRRESRMVDAARGSIEASRLRRLHRLMRLVPYYRSLPITDRTRVHDALGCITPPVSGSPPAHPLAPPSYVFPHDLADLLHVSDPLAATSRSEPHCPPPPPSPGRDACPLFDDPDDDVFPSLPFVHWNPAVQPPTTPRSVDSLRSELAALYSEYSQSVSQLAPVPLSPHDPDLDLPVEHAMSKQQLQMALDEGHLWSVLSQPPSDPVPPETESVLLSLAHRSTAISRSYQRRTNAPTAQTYQECKTLVRAMGVPCVDSSGPFEAEALACALVARGHADYVVSEDTDVLVYEAPLLRGITARESPIVLVHGESIRATLALDRPAYVDFALLLGTDFSQRIKNVGPNRALKFIRQHGSIERVVERESKYPPRVPVPDYLEQVGVARLVFQSLPPLPDPALLRQTEGDPDALSDIIQRHRLQRVLSGAWDAQSALAGNYFGDDPSVW